MEWLLFCDHIMFLIISFLNLISEGKLSGGVNREGINYYNKLINRLLRKGQDSILKFQNIKNLFYMLWFTFYFSVTKCRSTTFCNNLPLVSSPSIRRWLWWFPKSTHCVSEWFTKNLPKKRRIIYQIIYAYSPSDYRCFMYILTVSYIIMILNNYHL